MARVAVVLMNLGGPDSLEAVQPFLVNLFSDPAIIGLPGLLRLPLARFVAWRRAQVARDIYMRLGGRSPLLANTEAQARALEAVVGTGDAPRLLLTAHGLPKKIVRAGGPYPDQVEQTASAVVAALARP